jgi:hypothetical protein
MRPPAPHRGLARCSPPPRLRQGWACNDGLAMTALITPARRRRLPSHASDWRRFWSVTPGIRPAMTVAYSTQHNGSGSRAAKPAPLPLPPTPLPGGTPFAIPLHGGPQGSRRRRQARPRTGKTSPRIRWRQSSAM